jgi:hypothetical protein
MVFIQRDSEHNICAIFKENKDNKLEYIDNAHPDVIQFLTHCAMEKTAVFIKSDLELIRVLEDLIQILMTKNIISITDFPAPVVEKLVQRAKIREQFLDISFIVKEN